MRVFRQLILFYLFFVLFPASGILAGEKTIQNNSFELDSNHSSFYPTDDSGLIFEKTLRYISKDSSYTDILQLKNLSGIAQAIQFRIQLNKVEDDSTILIFDNLEKGADISNQNWVVNYNLIKGTVLPNGASKDEVIVLIYNLNQNGGLPPGDYSELLKVNYIVADLPVLQDSVKSSMKITHAQASTAQGQPIDITPSRDEFKLIIKAITIIPSQGLIFEKDTVYRLEYDSYVDIMQLKGLTDKAQALQFRLLVNQSVDDNVILTFQNIQKGSDVIDPSWILTYNVFRGPLTGNGASVDEILVLLFNLDQNNGLPPGDYDELLKVKYRVADLPALQDSIKSSIKILNAEASTYQGFPIDITPSRDELTIIAQNRVSAYGDVNGDGCLDILDIIMIVDHIVGRDSLETDEFARANIAPWIPGEPAPNPDAYVNVQDLSLLQNIILTGVYPNGILINACSFTSIEKINSGEDFKVTFYIYEAGMTLYSNASVDVRAVQVEFAGNIQISNNMFINTDLGNGYFNKDDEILRVLLYDRKGIKTVKSGENFIADIPSFINNPEDISIEKLILVDINRQRIMDAEIEIVYGTPPYIPLDYILYQNFPNPFNPSTSVRFEVPIDSKVMIKIYDILGREVKTLFNEQVPRGNYTIEWDGLNESGIRMSSGTYIYRMIANEFVQSKKMLLLK